MGAMDYCGKKDMDRLSVAQNQEVINCIYFFYT